MIPIQKWLLNKGISYVQQFARDMLVVCIVDV